VSSGFALIIEDDADLATIFSEALKAAGFRTEIIRDGQTAVQRLAAATPDVVVLDLHLPQVAGEDLLNQIHADARLSKTRVVVATADARSAEMLHEEADLVLVKPISFTQLRDLAARLGATS
jgi:DNA-binding response OmpR family regulator